MERPKTLLVTGGAGYIGSVCTEQLVEDGYKVVVMDDLSFGNREAVHPKATFVKGNIGNIEILNRLFKKYNFYAVIHLAADSIIAKSYTHRAAYFNNNLHNSRILLNTMVLNNCRRIIFSSTAAVYGIPKKIPIDENHAMNPISSYGESKLEVEKTIKYFATTFGLRSVIFRYFNASGASLKFGDAAKQQTHIVSILMNVVMGKQKHFQIFGDDYPTRDGTCIRDYIHVLDIAQAHRLALSKMDTCKFCVYNLGNGKGYSVKEIIDAVQRVTKKKIVTINSPMRIGDPAELISSHQKAKVELGWSPINSDLENIIKSAWKWHNRFPDGYRKIRLK